MAARVKILCANIQSGGTTFATGSTYFLPVAQSGLSNNHGTRTDAAITYRTGGTLSNMVANKLAGTLATTMSATLEVGAAAANSTITFTSTNGQYEDTTHTDAIAVGGSVNYSVVASGAGTNLLLSNLGMTWKANDTTAFRFSMDGGAGGMISTASTNFFVPVTGIGFANTTQAQGEWLVKLPPGVSGITLRNLFVRINSNTSAAAVTMTVNGATGAGTAPTVTIALGSGATTQEDTTNSIIAKDGDKISIKAVTGAGTATCIPSQISIEVQNNYNVWFYVAMQQLQSAQFNPGFWPMSGGRVISNATESNVQSKHGMGNQLLSMMSVYCTRSAASTSLGLRANGANVGAPAVINVPTTGTAPLWVTDTTNHYLAGPSDLLCFSNTGSATDPELTTICITVQDQADVPKPNNYQDLTTSGAGGWTTEQGFRL